MKNRVFGMLKDKNSVRSKSNFNVYFKIRSYQYLIHNIKRIFVHSHAQHKFVRATHELSYFKCVKPLKVSKCQKIRE